MMLAGLFMSVFLVGMLYYFLGVADAIALQERLQASADANAFEASVTMARALNFVALLNSVMMTLAASLMAGNLQVIAGLVCVAQGSLPHDGCQVLLARMRAIEEQITPPMQDTIGSASAAAQDIVRDTPVVAGDEVARRLAAEESYVLAGFMVPHEMPFEAQGSEPLCAIANLYAFRLVEITLGRATMEELIGRGFPRIGRDLPQCEDMRGGAVALAPPGLPVGTEPLQVRVVIVGDARRLVQFGRGVRVGQTALGTRPAGETTRTWAGTRDPDRILVMAQAEYYSDWELANIPRDTNINATGEESFRMLWRGRLRRLRIPTGGPDEPVRRAEVRDAWIRDVLWPACGSACGGLEDAAVQASESFH